ncbi:MAG: hypothetical protein AAFU77_09130 [Myxococcota bacterium]
MAELGVCGYCGRLKQLLVVEEPGCGCCADCRPLAEKLAVEHQQLLDHYRAQPGDPSLIPMSWQAALGAVHEFLGEEMDCNPEDSIEAATWWYIPIGWIGCCGFAVRKTDGEVTQFGSAHGLGAWLWGFAHGAVANGPVDLTITSVSDEAATIEFLHLLGRRNPFNPGAQNSMPSWSELRALISNAPCTFPRVILWPTLDELKKRHDAGHFEFTAKRNDE